MANGSGGGPTNDNMKEKKHFKQFYINKFEGCIVDLFDSLKSILEPRRRLLTFAAQHQEFWQQHSKSDSQMTKLW